MSACQVDRYGSHFVIYSSANIDAHVIDRGGAIVLIHYKDLDRP